jgi:hypothetical protein
MDSAPALRKRRAPHTGKTAPKKAAVPRRDGKACITCGSNVSSGKWCAGPQCSACYKAAQRKEKKAAAPPPHPPTLESGRLPRTDPADLPPIPSTYVYKRELYGDFWTGAEVEAEVEAEKAKVSG